MRDWCCVYKKKAPGSAFLRKKKVYYFVNSFKNVTSSSERRYDWFRNRCIISNLVRISVLNHLVFISQTAFISLSLNVPVGRVLFFPKLDHATCRELNVTMFPPHQALAGQYDILYL